MWLGANNRPISPLPTPSGNVPPVTKTFNSAKAPGGSPFNFQSLVTAAASLVSGDHLEIQSPTSGSSQASPHGLTNNSGVAERLDLTNIKGNSTKYILLSVRKGDYVMLDVAFGLLSTAWYSGLTVSQRQFLTIDPGKSLLHLENSSWVICDFRDQTKSNLLDFSQELDPTINWAMALGNRAHWLSTASNNTLPTSGRYQHYASSNQLNSDHYMIVGCQVNGAATFTASFSARDCSRYYVRYCDTGCHGTNDESNGDLWVHQGDHFRVIDTYTHHTAHQNMSFEGTNFVTRRLRGNGGWSDIPTGQDGDTYAGGNVSSGRFRKWGPNPFALVGNVWQVPLSFDPGYSLHEFNHYQNTGKSLNLTNTGLPFMKLEGLNPILRFSVFDHHRTTLGYTLTGSSSEPIASNTGIDTSALVVHGRAQIYHNAATIINGIFLYEDSELPVRWVAGTVYSGGTYIFNSQNFVYKGGGGKSGTNEPIGTGVVSDGVLSWTFQVGHMLANANHGWRNRILNNVFDQSSTAQNLVPMLECNLANSGLGRGTLSANNSKGFVIRGNIMNWVAGVTTLAQEYQFQCTGPADTFNAVAAPPGTYVPNIGNNRNYSPAWINVSALSNNLCSVAIQGMILAPSNSDGLGTAEPLATVNQNSGGTTISVDDAGPFFDGMGFTSESAPFPSETPDTISIFSGGVRIQVQLAAGGKDLTNDNLTLATSVTVLNGDTINIVKPGTNTVLLNNGVG